MAITRTLRLPSTKMSEQLRLGGHMLPVTGYGNARAVTIGRTHITGYWVRKCPSSYDWAVICYRLLSTEMPGQLRLGGYVLPVTEYGNAREVTIGWTHATGY